MNTTVNETENVRSYPSRQLQPACGEQQLHSVATPVTPPGGEAVFRVIGEGGILSESVCRQLFGTRVSHRNDGETLKPLPAIPERGTAVGAQREAVA